MNLAYSSEQLMLKESIRRFVERECEQPGRTQAPARLWAQFAELGWLGIPLDEDFGGLAGDMVDVGIVMEGLGSGLVVEPYLSTVVFAASLIARLGTPAQRETLLPAIADGSRRIAVAFEAVPGARGANSPCRAVDSGVGWVLDGALLAHDGPSCDTYIVHAALQDREPEQQALFLVRRGASGIEERAVNTLDGRTACLLRLDGVSVDQDARLGSKQDVVPDFRRAQNRAVAAACAEAVGSIQALLDATVGYAKTRVQFGRPIADNQVVKHRLVDMFVQCEEARSTALRALLLCESEGAEAACSGARLKVARCGTAVAEHAIQLHGAMGVTEELPVGQHVKRLLAFEMRHGSNALHVARRMATLGAPA